MNILILFFTAMAPYLFAFGVIEVNSSDLGNNTISNVKAKDTTQALSNIEAKLAELEKKANESFASTLKIYDHLTTTVDDITKKFTSINDIIMKIKPQWNVENENKNFAPLDGSQTLTFFGQRNSPFRVQSKRPPGNNFISYTKFVKTKNFDPISGIFTALQTGYYYVYFSALKTKTEYAETDSLTVQLLRISRDLSTGSPEKIIQEVMAEGHASSNDQYGWFQVNLRATVLLEKHQAVAIDVIEGSIHGDGSDRHLTTAFGGFLVKETYTVFD